MNKCFIGFGECSKYYLYILSSTVLKSLRDCMFGFNSINPNSKMGLFGFVPKLANHCIIQSIYRYSGFMLGGALFMYISQKNSENKSEKMINKEKEQLELKEFENSQKSERTKNVRISQIIIIALIYCAHSELSRIMYLFDFSGLDFWTVDLLFIIIFMHSNFVINSGKHKKYSMIFIILLVTILLLISSFLPKTDHDKEEEKIKDKNTYQLIKAITGNNYSFIIIALIFFSLSCLLSYLRVQEKVLMDFHFLSPYRLIFFIGFVGFILSIVILTLTTNLKCSEENAFIRDKCLISRIRKNKTEFYYDNLVKYFEELKSNKNGYEFYLEIILMPLLFLVISFFEFLGEILTIYYLSPIYILVRDNIYYGTIKLIFLLYNLNKNYKQYMTLEQFIILEFAEILAILGYTVYFEIIELRCLGLDRDLKKNIIRRSRIESPIMSRELSFDEILDDSYMDEVCKNYRVDEIKNENEY